MDTIPAVLAHAAATWPDAAAVVGDDGTAWTFAELADRVDTAARTLAANGVANGARVALRGENTPQWIVANLAVLTAGGAVLPLNPRSREAEVAEVLERAACTMALDAELQPIGAFSGAIEGYDELMAALVAAGRLRGSDAGLARMALGFLAKPGAGGRPQIATSLTIQDGQMLLGPIKLGPAPRISW